MAFRKDYSTNILNDIQTNNAFPSGKVITSQFTFGNTFLQDFFFVCFMDSLWKCFQQNTLVIKIEKG